MILKSKAFVFALLLTGLTAAAQPVISNVRVDAVSHSGARITWTTDVISNSQVEFGPTSSYGFKTGYTYDSSTSHGYFLSGLAPSTTYHFRPISWNSVGMNAPYADMTFTTLPEPAVHPTLPAAVQRKVDVSLPTQTGSVWNVDTACSNLQALLDSSTTKLGDTIVIPAGTTCTGNYILPGKTEGTGWIVIRTSTPDSQLPPGTRVTPETAPLMARVRTARPGKVWYRDTFSTVPGTAAHHYRFVGIEFTHTSTALTTDTDPEPFWRLVTITPDAHHIVFDRCYFHGLGYPNRLQTAMFLDGSDVAVINSRIDTVNSWVPDNQATAYGGDAAFGIVVDNGAGPGLVENNYFDVVGLPFFISDNNPTAPPSDYEIKRNHFFMPDKYLQGSPTSDGHRYINRSNIEMKKGIRISIDGNLFENQWADITIGGAVLLSSRFGSDGGQNSSMISDIGITNNIFRNVCNGIVVFAHSPQGWGNTKGTHNVRIANNLFDSLNGYTRVSLNGSTKNGTAGAPMLIYAGIEDLTIEHNTVYNNRGLFPVFLAEGYEWHEGLRFENNVLWWNKDASSGHTGIYHEGVDGLTPSIPFIGGTQVFDGGWRRLPTSAYSFRRNVMIPGVIDQRTSNLGPVDLTVYAPTSPTDLAAPKFPWDNLWSTSAADAGLLNVSNGDFSLDGSSRFHNQGTDGRDPGVDMAALRAAQSATLSSIQASAPATLTLTATPSTQSAQAGSSAVYTLNLTSSSTTLASATISASVAQPGVTAILSSPTISTSAPVTLTLASAATAATGTYTVAVTNTGTNGTQGTTVSLTVTAPAVTKYATTFGTVPSGLSYTVDGVTLSSGTTLQWAAGSTHTITASNPPVSGGTGYVFQTWNDGGAQSHQVVANGAATYTANYMTAYLLNATAQGTGSVSVSPASSTGLYPASSVVGLRALPGSGACFTGWSNLPTGTPAATSVTMTQPYSIVANFQTGSVRANISALQPSANGGSYAVVVMATSGCVWNFGTTASWIRPRVVPPTSGSAVVSLTVDPNSTGATRTAVVSFGPATVTVTQPSR